MADKLRVPLYKAEKDMEPCTVAVTGATGYVAGALIQRLLASGHSVHATCRNPDNKASIAHLVDLPGAEKRLKFFKADLLVDGSFTDAIQGCTYVFHTASPLMIYCPSGQEQEKLVAPAVEGTRNVVNAVNATKSVEKLIVTSSVAAIYGDPHEKGENYLYTERDWNDLASLKILPYFYSKTLAERTATEMCKSQNRWKIAVINPGMIFGPPLFKRADSESVQLMKSIVGGLMWFGAPNMGIGVVDIRDVAAGHCMAMANKEACGRHILVSNSYDFLQMADMLRPLYPFAYLANFRLWSIALRIIGPFVEYPSDFLRYLYGKTPLFDTSKAKKLGLTFVDHLESMDDMIQTMSKNGVLSKRFLKDAQLRYCPPTPIDRNS